MVVADSGHLTQLRDGSRAVTLNKGTRLAGRRCYAIFASPDFLRKTIVLSIGHQAVADPNDTDQMDMRTLWNTDNEARAELHWRNITLVLPYL